MLLTPPLFNPNFGGVSVPPDRRCWASTSTWSGTVDNHGNTEITETVIFVKCRECRDFAKMPCFAVFFFCQNAVVVRFHENIYCF